MKKKETQWVGWGWFVVGRGTLAAVEAKRDEEGLKKKRKKMGGLSSPVCW